LKVGPSKKRASRIADSARAATVHADRVAMVVTAAVIPAGRVVVGTAADAVVSEEVSAPTDRAATILRAGRNIIKCRGEWLFAPTPE
jgi:hypothetical protein